METVKKMPGTSLLVSFVLGLIIGLVFLGWYVFPVEFTGTTPAGLLPEYQAIYVRNAAELYSFDHSQDKVKAALGGWGGDVVACQMAAESADPADQQRLQAAATAVNGTGCAGITAGSGQATPGTLATSPTTPETETGTSDTNKWLLPLLLLLLLGLLGGAAWYVYNRRREMMAEEQVPVQRTSRPPAAASAATYAPVASTRPAEAAPTYVEAPLADEGPVAVPIARFRTNYTYGHDTYDDSFSIENTNGEFMGECGVGIAEVMGTGSPKAVTALEVWLFDKNDIRTITKVVMSDHAFFDEALKAKLAPKGEPVLARQNETIVLETASLIINAEIADLAYGDNADLPDRSYFELFSIEISAWSKEAGGDVATGSVDDIMNY